MEVFVQQLASVCRQHVTRNKWVFVPSHALGHTVGERIALSGTNWLNLCLGHRPSGSHAPHAAQYPSCAGRQ